jgi:hypothetical protein
LTNYPSSKTEVVYLNIRTEDEFGHYVDSKIRVWLVMIAPPRFDEQVPETLNTTVVYIQDSILKQWIYTTPEAPQGSTIEVRIADLFISQKSNENNTVSLYALP